MSDNHANVMTVIEFSWGENQWFIQFFNTVMPDESGTLSKQVLLK